MSNSSEPTPLATAKVHATEVTLDDAHGDSKSFSGQLLGGAERTDTEMKKHRMKAAGERRMRSATQTRSREHVSHTPLSKEEARKKYFPLLADVETYLTHMDEEIKLSEGRLSVIDETTLKVHTYLPSDPEVKSAEVLLNEETEVFRKKVRELVNAESNMDQYLNYLLFYRKVRIQNRNIGINNFLGGDNSLHLPLDEQLYKIFFNRSYCRQEETRAKNRSIRKKTVEKYAFLNWLIKRAYQKCDPIKLSQETINLLRAATQLHPILEGTRTDMGHPDEHTFCALLKQLFAPYLNKYPDPER
ncbi:MAG: hypothetical protein AAFP93_00175, partial [Bacteroidota bacterium]